MELAKEGTDASHLRSLKARLDDEFRLGDPQLDSVQVEGAPSKIEILQRLDLETRSTAKLLASCSEAMGSVERAVPRAEQDVAIGSSGLTDLDRISQAASTAQTIAAQCRVRDAPTKQFCPLDVLTIETQEKQLLAWSAELSQAEADLEQITVRLTKAVREAQNAVPSSPGSARRALASARHGVKEAQRLVSETESSISESRSCLDLARRFDELEEQTSDFEIELLRAVESSKWLAPILPLSSAELQSLRTGLSVIQHTLESTERSIAALNSSNTHRTILAKARAAQGQMEIVSALHGGLQRVVKQRDHAEKVSTEANLILDTATKSGSTAELLKRVDALERLLISTPMAAESDYKALKYRHGRASSSYQPEIDNVAVTTPPGSPRPTLDVEDPASVADLVQTQPVDERSPAMLALESLAVSDQRIRAELNELFLRVKAAVHHSDSTRITPSELAHAAITAGATTAPDAASPRENSQRPHLSVESPDVVPHPVLEAAVKKAVRRSLPKHAGDMHVVATETPNIDREYIGGKYTFTWGGKSYVRYCRTLLGRGKALVMVRVGGGWEGVDQ